MVPAQARFETVALSLLEAHRVPVKSLKLLAGRTFMATFFGEASARKAAELLAPVLRDVRVYSGFDPGKATAIRNAVRSHVGVWRIMAQLREI